MSPQPTNPNPDLNRLISEGYEIEQKHGHLIMHGVPYVTEDREVRRGKLISELTLAGNRTTRPSTHVMMFAGARPCDRFGRPLQKIINSESPNRIAEGLVAQFSFSSKPSCGYFDDYYAKMKTYADILESQAQAIDSDVTARTFRVIASSDRDSPFRYVDTASSRAGITSLSKKLETEDVAIVGLGGTGSYVHDGLVKCPIQRIHTFDDDTYLQHNVFRSPGAASVEDLQALPKKVHYYADMYGKMHKGIYPNAVRVTKDNVDLLRPMDFVFLCMDASPDKKAIIDALTAFGTTFIDVGLGLDLVDGGLIGSVRITTSHAGNRASSLQRIPLGGLGDANLYDRNIQVLELNALGAMLAILKWKKLRGFYCDLEGETSTIFNVDGNHLLNEALPCIQSVA
ncbi:MAG: ThiF family adenylyltransferase [Ruegeria sp.]|uniref:ThiF family adenylyltransferase n=1 Tax=Ruegeria sp. TaxID=1879320 RepID=UPI00349EFD5C